MTRAKRTNHPAMVDVGSKKVTRRRATAEAIVDLPPALLERIEDGDIRTPKGNVFPVASVAGVLAAKRCHELIPLCHPIALERCDMDLRVDRNARVVIRCVAEAHHKTGVEMEALTAVTVAALTVYDLCKSVSQGIVIQSVRLIEKKGGKSDYSA